MAKTQIRPEQAKTLATFDDQKAPGVALETTTFSLEEFLQGVISQLNRLIHTDATGNDWYSDFTAPTTFENGVKRAADLLNQNLHDLERRRLLCIKHNLNSINVPFTQNFVVLSAASFLPPNLTAAVGDVTTLGTVVAAHTGTFGTHSLDVVTGFNDLNPKNIVPIVDSTTRDPILSSGRQVYGLLQSENATDGHTILANTPNGVQISFVRLDAVGGALEACPVSDIEARDFTYGAVERIGFQDFDEQMLLPGALFDATAGGGGGGSVEERAVSIATDPTIAANTLIIGSGPGQNTSNDLIDYEDANFISEVKIYINGRLMRNGSSAGSNFDVYPSAVIGEQQVGAFYCEFDIQQDDVIQMFVGDATVTGGAAVWGGITGTLSAQTDLQGELDAKVPTAGTGAQDAALFTERSDHVNTPAAGAAELWLNDGTRQALILTDDQGDDRYVTFTDNLSNVNNALAIWQNAGGGYYLGDISALTYNAGTLAMASANANVQLAERSTSPTPTAGYGHWWVKDDTPSTPQFTDDSGVNGRLLRGPTPGGTVQDSVPTFNSAKDLQNNTLLLFQGGELRMASATAAVELQERATGPTSAAAKGHWWVKDDAPNTAMFTDDAGNAYELGDRVHRLWYPVRNGSATANQYVRSPSWQPNTYQSSSVSAGTTQGSPTAAAFLSTFPVAPFDGFVTRIVGQLRYWGTSGSGTYVSDLELWKVTGADEDTAYTYTELGGGGGVLEISDTTTGTASSGIQIYNFNVPITTSNAVNAGDMIEVLLYNVGAAVSGYPNVSMNIEFSRTNV